MPDQPGQPVPRAGHPVPHAGHPVPHTGQFVLRMGHVVRLLRAVRGWTQSELSYRSRVSQFLISQLETGRGRPGPEALSRLQTALGVSFDDPRLVQGLALIQEALQ